ncbi:MAG: hypothetical protein RBS57_08330, partial [Desulforhabdus sp.]|nr:hypothetical protein [Desulforhabdus sp.]
LPIFSDSGKGASFRTKLGLMMASLSILGVAGFFQWQRAQAGAPLQEVRMEWLAASISIPVGWHPLAGAENDGARSTTFTGPVGTLTPPMLNVAGEYLAGGTLLDLIARKERSLKNYSRSALEDWRRYYPAAVALHYNIQEPLNDGSTSLITGLSVFLPIGGEEVMVLTFLDNPENRDARVLDMIRMVESAADMLPGTARFTERQPAPPGSNLFTHQL